MTTRMFMTSLSHQDQHFRMLIFPLCNSLSACSMELTKLPTKLWKLCTLLGSQSRLDGDHDNDKALIAETMKLIGNSSYGKLITHKEEHHNIVYVNESEIGTEIMDEHFYNLTELLDGCYEVKKLKRKLTSIYLFILVSLFSTTPNSKCSNFITIFWTITFIVKTLRSSRWTRKATISKLLAKMWKI